MSVGSEAAAAILQAFGGDVGTVSVSFKRKTVTTTSAAGAPTFTSETTSTANAFVLPPSEGSHMSVWGSGVDPATLSSAEYAFLWVAGSGMSFVPRRLDKVVIDGSDWVVLGCDNYGLSGTSLAFAVGARKL